MAAHRRHHALVVVDVARRRNGIVDQAAVHDHLAVEVAQLAQVGSVGAVLAEQRGLRGHVLARGLGQRRVVELQPLVAHRGRACW